MTKKEQTWSLKEVDNARGVVKGTTFKAFKQLREGFDEGRDYFYLSGDQDSVEIETLRSKSRIYEGTVNAILLTESGYAAIMEYLDD